MVARNAADLAILNALSQNIKRIAFSGGFVSNQPAV